MAVSDSWSTSSTPLEDHENPATRFVVGLGRLLILIFYSQGYRNRLYGIRWITCIHAGCRLTLSPCQDSAERVLFACYVDRHEPLWCDCLETKNMLTTPNIDQSQLLGDYNDQAALWKLKEYRFMALFSVPVFISYNHRSASCRKEINLPFGEIATFDFPSVIGETLPITAKETCHRSPERK